MKPGDPNAKSPMEDDREAKLAARGLPPEAWSPRLRHSLDLAAGRRKLYLQQPTAFNYPGLPQVQFYDPSEFSWAPAIEAAAATMRQELLALVEQGTDEFSAYIHRHSEGTELGANTALLANRDWSVLFLCENGWIVPKVIERCPRTWQAVLHSAPLPRVAGWGPDSSLLLAQGGGADRAAHRHVQHPADLPPAADRAARLPLPGRQ
jgi:hypothetical protein